MGNSNANAVAGRVQAIILTDAKYDNVVCGKCFSILLGFDEEVCPVCGAFQDFDNVVNKMTTEIFPEV